MKRDEAAALVNRIVSTWPTGPKGHIWTEVLADLDHPTAEQVYVRLRAEHERAPAIATFLAAYRLADADRQRHEQPPESTHRDADNGAGWIPPSGYLRRLEARAAAGDDQAATESATWHRFLDPERRRHGWTWTTPT